MPRILSLALLALAGAGAALASPFALEERQFPSAQTLLENAARSLWRGLVSPAGYTNANFCSANGYGSIASATCMDTLAKVTSVSDAVEGVFAKNSQYSSRSKYYAARVMHQILYGDLKTFTATFYATGNRWQLCYQSAEALVSALEISLDQRCGGTNAVSTSNSSMYIQLAYAMHNIGTNFTVSIFPRAFKDNKCFGQYFTCCTSKNSVCAITTKTTLYDVNSTNPSLEIPPALTKAIAEFNAAQGNAVSTRGVMDTIQAAQYLYNELKDTFAELKVTIKEVTTLVTDVIADVGPDIVASVKIFVKVIKTVAKVIMIVAEDPQRAYNNLISVYVTIVLGFFSLASQLTYGANAGYPGAGAWDANVCDSMIITVMKSVGATSPCSQSVLYAMQTVQDAHDFANFQINPYDPLAVAKSSQCTAYLSMCCGLKATCTFG